MSWQRYAKRNNEDEARGLRAPHTSDSLIRRDGFRLDRKERCIERRIDDRLREADHRVETRIAGQAVNLLFEWNAVDRFIRDERDSDGAIVLQVRHRFRERRRCIERDVPIDAAFRLHHDRVVAFGRDRSAPSLRKEREEDGVPVRESR